MPQSTFTITYAKPGTLPPLFVAGSFSSPPWEPQELHQDDEGSDSFSRTFSVVPGTYQYKFRLGTGDWWVVDETQETATDDQGNVNNVLLVQEHQPVSTSADVSDAQRDNSVKSSTGHTLLGDMFPKAGELELPPSIPVAESSVQADDGPAISLPQTKSATAAATATVTSASNISHDLPTPPLSEGGDDVENKGPYAEPSADVSQASEDPPQTSKVLKEEKSSSGPSSKLSRNWMILLAVAAAVIPVVAWSLRP